MWFLLVIVSAFYFDLEDFESGSCQSEWVSKLGRAWVFGTLESASAAGSRPGKLYRTGPGIHHTPFLPQSGLLYSSHLIDFFLITSFRYN